ncbi:Regulator of chromosome condensation RCC1 [Macrophomina phaseolina MS6]|uniref:Regulator of chromosome condensation RCC1 n=1 Tax=Macrophomina phaseolina (strain MS6) TaxID=1126212 RepID=K2RQH8_MACPH|nr:Regulator of chromosome condensation RCC1 [Macrophomina phaseolina MS6]
MLPTRCLRQSAYSINKTAARGTAQKLKACPARSATTTTRPAPPGKRFPRSVAILTGVGTVAAIYQYSAGNQIYRNAYAEAPEEPGLIFEKPRKAASSKEENRDIISSQHLQVKRSWENPGVYAWGSNDGRVVAPDSKERYIKTPRRLPFFDGVLLRDVKLDRFFGAAINEKGDLLQWGTAFDKDCNAPAVTLRGKDLKSLALSKDRIIALGSNGKVYSVPVSKEEQETGKKASESSWVPFLSSTAPISYRRLEPKNLASGEKITSVAGGLEHVLLLTSKGRVFSSASSALDYPSKGQLGIPGLSWQTRPQGPYDTPHEITTLKGFDIAKIAAGDYHSVAADKDGRVFSFGDNSFGQLGIQYDPEVPFVDSPSLVPIQSLYRGTGLVPKVTGIAAGGNNTYFTVDATRVSNPGADDSNPPARRNNLGNITADAWACGQGIWGGLGNGRWTHVQDTPTKIPAFSGLFEFDEASNRVVPIRLAQFAVGANHVAGVMANIAYLHAGTVGTGRRTDAASANETNWGADILFFGNNEHYQIGTGKRNNVSNPTYIQPLDQAAERKVRGKEEHRFQITPKKQVKFNGRWVDMEQRVECGRGVTAVYSGV